MKTSNFLPNSPKTIFFSGLDDSDTGCEINFFSDSHLAPKFFKVVANSKKVGRHFQRQTKPFFMLSAF